MSAENDRIRRELGVDLARAGRDAGVAGPIENQHQAEPHDDDLVFPYLICFPSFDQR